MNNIEKIRHTLKRNSSIRENDLVNALQRVHIGNDYVKHKSLKSKNRILKNISEKEKKKMIETSKKELIKMLTAKNRNPIVRRKGIASKLSKALGLTGSEKLTEEQVKGALNTLASGKFNKTFMRERKTKRNMTPPKNSNNSNSSNSNNSNYNTKKAKKSKK